MSPSDSERLAALERQVAALTEEVARLRAAPDAEESARRRIADQLRAPPARVARPIAPAPTAAHVELDEARIESLVGRYGTLIFAALVILMGVGALIELAVARGLLTVEVRLALGALAAAMVGGAGLWFRGRGELRYGDVLLALALAIVDLVAWGAGPRLHVIPTGVALALVDVVAMALAALALHDDNEFLFAVAVGGALTAPFVTSSGGGSAAGLLSYAAVLLLGALRSVRDPGWMRAFGVLVAGAVVHALAAASLPMSGAWYGPFLIAGFAGVCAVGALLFAQPEWRGALARAYLAAGVIGVVASWDRLSAQPVAVTAAVSLALAAVTYAALRVRQPRQVQWTASALALPLVSLGIAYAATRTRWAEGGVLALWTAFALGAWRWEARRGEPARGATHLLAGGLLGAAAIVAALWPSPLPLVAGLGAWGVALAWAAQRETTPLPLVAVSASLGGAAVSAFDQLASRQAYAYVPFLTRSSASALCATLGLWAGSELLGAGGGERGADRWADRRVRLGILVAFVIVWGRMEFANAFSPDLATFLLTLYYAAIGVAAILVGRRLGVGRMRLLGLALALYAAVKAIVEAQGIESLSLRVGVYGAVGVFLLGAGYLYRKVGAGV